MSPGAGNAQHSRQRRRSRKAHPREETGLQREPGIDSPVAEPQHLPVPQLKASRRRRWGPLPSFAILVGNLLFICAAALEGGGGPDGPGRTRTNFPSAFRETLLSPLELGRRLATTSAVTGPFVPGVRV